MFYMRNRTNEWMPSACCYLLKSRLLFKSSMRNKQLILLSTSHSNNFHTEACCRVAEWAYMKTTDDSIRPHSTVILTCYDPHCMFFSLLTYCTCLMLEELSNSKFSGTRLELRPHFSVYYTRISSTAIPQSIESIIFTILKIRLWVKSCMIYKKNP